MSQALFVCRINDWKDQLALGMGRFYPTILSVSGGK